MDRNVGGFDRILRIVVGVGMVVTSMTTVVLGGSLGESDQIVLAGVTLFVGALLLLTASSRRCMVYGLIGRNTYRAGSEERRSG